MNFNEPNASGVQLFIFYIDTKSLQMEIESLFPFVLDLLATFGSLLSLFYAVLKDVSIHEDTPCPQERMNHVMGLICFIKNEGATD